MDLRVRQRARRGAPRAALPALASYPKEASELSFDPSDVEDAAARVQGFIKKIDLAGQR